MKINFTNLFLYIVLTSIQLSAQTTYEIIDLGPGSVSDISKNGQFVCGMNYPAPAYIWSETAGRVELGVGEYSEAYDVSNNGTVAGRFYDPTLPAPGGNPTLRAGFWKNGSWNALMGLSGFVPLDEISFTHAYGISADGSTIVGMQWHPNWKVEAVRWIDGNITGLGQTFGENSRANVVSANGSVIAGWNAGPAGIPDREAYSWDPTPHFLGGFDQTYLVGECGGISSDGSIIVGTSIWPFIWTAATGMQQVVADSSDYDQGYSLGVSDDGTIVGWVDPVGGGFNYQAFIKKPGWADILYLKNYIIDSLGIAGYNNWYFAFGQAISADGKVIGISAYPPGSGISEALLLRINEPVPVELTSFSATVNHNVVNLNWSTATELNNSGFEVERKTANIDWQKITFIQGNGTTTSQSNYNFTDQNPNTGINIYRLKQVDYDGTYDYSNEIEIEVVPAEYVLQQNYPNPFNPTTTINFNTPQEDFVNVTIFNSLGEKVVALLDGVLSAGSHALTFDATGLASGLYILKMTAGNFSKTIKMNLMK